MNPYRSTRNQEYLLKRKHEEENRIRIRNMCYLDRIVEFFRTITPKFLTGKARFNNL
jgi:hypothetical protein